MLDADYRGFITTVGHGGPGRWGGAGPYYGLHPLDDWDHALWNLPEPGTLATPFPAQPGRVYQRWPEEVVAGADAEVLTGAIALSDQGCGMMSLLVVSGPARGRIVGSEGTPEGPIFTPDPDFLSWYERWLDAVLAGRQHFW